MGREKEEEGNARKREHSKPTKGKGNLRKRRKMRKDTPRMIWRLTKMERRDARRSEHAGWHHVRARESIERRHAESNSEKGKNRNGLHGVACQRTRRPAGCG